MASLNAISTTGAPFHDASRDGKKFPVLSPYNVISVYGTPGAKIEADTLGGGKFKEADGTADPTHLPSTTQLDTHGRADLHVYYDFPADGSAQRENRAVTIVTVYYAEDTTDKMPSLSPLFMPYKRTLTNTAILGYSNTTGAPANGDDPLATPCSIYVVIDNVKYSNVTKVRFTITNAVQYQVWVADDSTDQKNTFTDVDLNADGSASVDILSNTPNTPWKIEISARPSSDLAHVTVDFITPPKIAPALS